MKEVKILYVEDDESIGYIVKDNLEMNGYHVILCSDGEQGLMEINKQSFDLCILDIMLPKLDGFSLAAKIRENDAQVLIFFLTAKSLTEDKLKGFRIGGDDYITKPFSFHELLLRIEVFLKRSGITCNDDKIYRLGNVIFDYDNLVLQSGGISYNLTQKEADIIKIFCDNPNTVIKRDIILNKIWGDNDYFMGRSLDVFIVKIRRYLAQEPLVQIQNVHGIGFKFLIKENV
jgi:DNA-binding response OmpR family regulator